MFSIFLGGGEGEGGGGALIQGWALYNFFGYEGGQSFKIDSLYWNKKVLGYNLTIDPMHKWQ